jgi:catechol 2,3-dioxygenase-like lactoylglutathione lyase family enzyme
MRFGAKPQPMEAISVPAMPKVNGLFETHLTVSDLDRSIEFYRATVGLPQRGDRPVSLRERSIPQLRAGDLAGSSGHAPRVLEHEGTSARES